MVVRFLGTSQAVEVVATSRRAGGSRVPFDARSDSIAALLATTGCDWVVNCIGMLHGRIDPRDPASVAEALEVNSVFPNRLAAAAGDRRVILIATDGVFAGSEAPYDEDRAPDEPGVYGRSKALGEVLAPHVTNLRCSVIGPEPPPGASLLAWALSQPAGATVPGYCDHRWNGVTSLHFAKLCLALIEADGLTVPPLLHVVPADVVTKAALLEMILAAYGRSDVTVRETDSPHPVDRTLGTRFEQEHRRLWDAAGYPRPPGIAQMLAELAFFG